MSKKTAEYKMMHCVLELIGNMMCTIFIKF